MSVMNNPGDNLQGNYQFQFHNPTVKCSSIHVRFNILWKICFRLYMFFTHKSNVKNTSNGPSWNFCHMIFLDTPPKFDEQIPKNDLETCISGFKYVLWINFGVANPLNFHEGKLPLWIRDSILSFGMDGCSNFESPNYLDPNHPASYHSLVAILTIFMEANQTPWPNQGTQVDPVLG